MLRFDRHAGITALCLTAALVMGSGVAQAKQTQFHLFNSTPSTSYTVVKNGQVLTTVNSSVDGAVVFADDAVTGNTYTISGGGAATPPSAPSGLSASGDDAGCAQVGWAANGEPDILGYRLYYGSSSGVYSDSVLVSGTGRTVCALPSGDYFFALRALNSAGLLSALSGEASASVSNGSVQPPLPPAAFSAANIGDGCARAQWFPSGSPDVTGYVISWGTESVAQGQATQYQNTADIGLVSTHNLCDLGEGTFYITVQAKNHLGMTSAPSPERTVNVSATTVLVTLFDVDADDFGVALTWEINADEPLMGFSVMREEAGNSAPEFLNDGRLLDVNELSFIDRTAKPSTEYTYQLIVISEDGAQTFSAAVTVTTNPLSVALAQNVPNPFNPTTTINFTLPKTMAVRLDIFDVRGRLVQTLVDEELIEGAQSVVWDGLNLTGSPVSSGAYFYRLAAGGDVRTKKMLLLK